MEKKFESIDLTQEDTAKKVAVVGAGSSGKQALVKAMMENTEVIDAAEKLSQTDEMKELDKQAVDDLKNITSIAGPELESELNMEENAVEYGTPRQAYVDIFSESLKDLKNINEIKMYGDSFKNQLNALTSGTFGKPMSDEEVDAIYEKFAKAGKGSFDELTKEEVDSILEGFELNTSELKVQDETQVYEFKRALISLICSTKESNVILERAEKEFTKIRENFNAEMDDLLQNIDLTEKIGEIAEQIEKEEDPVRKAELQDLYTGMYASISLDLITNKVNTKGINIIKKEAKKGFKKAQEKAMKQLDNDTNNLYLHPGRLEQSLLFLFPAHEEGVRVLLYLIYKRITKRRDIDSITRNFVNYFILNVNKMLKPEFNKEEMPVYHNIKKFVESV